MSMSSFTGAVPRAARILPPSPVNKQRRRSSPRRPSTREEMRGRILAAAIAFQRPYLNPDEVNGAVAALAEVAVEAAEVLLLLQAAVGAPIDKASAIAAQTWGELTARFPILDGAGGPEGEDEDEGDALDLGEGVDL